MAYNEMNSWTFTGLVGAFLDLSITYLFLCGSTLAYLASKFLGFFGLSLPCPFNGLFGYLEKKNCIQAMLVHDPSLKISSVQYSVLKRLPFDSFLSNFYDDREDDDEQHDSHSNSDCWQNGRNGIFGSIHKWKGRHRRHKRNAGGHRGNVPSSATQTALNSSATFSKLGNDVTEDSMTSVNSEDGRGTAKEIGWSKQGFEGLQMDYDSFAENKSMDGKELAMAIKHSASNQDFDGSDKNTTTVLGQALDEEHATCAALYIELEKERSAAASAADEAMAMILRLQEEKAAIEMEAKQYRRMIEAKSAYDAEEMNILKEIIIMREREKYFLEKEVEACKQMLYGEEQLEADTYDIAVMQEHGRSSEERDPLRIQQVSLQIAEFDETAAFLSSSIEKNDAHMFRSDDDINQEFKEKGPASKKEDLNHQERHVDEKAISAMEEEERCSETNPDQRSTPKTTEPKIIFPCNNEKMERCGEDSGFDCHVLDVHVISGASDMNNKEGEKRLEKATGVTSNAPKTSDNQTIIEPGRKRNSSDRSEGLPPLGPSQPKSFHRKSRSAFDYERSKIDNEVGWLRERLKIVQLGREKLNFLPAGHREKEQVESQILEDIVSQLREIRQLTEPGKALQQASLPPLSSKVISKKRHQQSASLGGLRSI
ncbi:hypothetical protein like AT4G13630 [Hibiscus trionum]|uniref:GTD-binding domain-containing protein n=1 Tax=Hibiscus trionum TaxID=183268 RepID=A0A9W7LHG0_HIBTR|nr:hypothetical protein like AT4G13630 [Hibiscus trionum]